MARLTKSLTVVLNLGLQAGFGPRPLGLWQGASMCSPSLLRLPWLRPRDSSAQWTVNTRGVCQRQTMVVNGSASSTPSFSVGCHHGSLVWHPKVNAWRKISLDFLYGTNKPLLLYHGDFWAYCYCSIASPSLLSLTTSVTIHSDREQIQKKKTSLLL